MGMGNESEGRGWGGLGRRGIRRGMRVERENSGRVKEGEKESGL